MSKYVIKRKVELPDGRIEWLDILGEEYDDLGQAYDHARELVLKGEYSRPLMVSSKDINVKIVSETTSLVATSFY
jgi:hypothetical protein